MMKKSHLNLFLWGQSITKQNKNIADKIEKENKSSIIFLWGQRNILRKTFLIRLIRKNIIIIHQSFLMGSMVYRFKILQIRLEIQTERIKYE